MARARQRLPIPDGWSSKGERIRDRYGNPVGLGLIHGEGDLMAAKNEVARGADVPLVLAQASQTRDALVDPQPGDYLGDTEKGNHVGEVRQPAEPVLDSAGNVTFESIADEPSKFARTYADDFEALEEFVQGNPDYEGTAHVPVTGDPEEAERIYQARRKAAAKPEPKPAPGG
jgi:hypothetical protein